MKTEPKTFVVRAAEGRRVRDPHSKQVLAPEGESKPQTSYWLRRLADGDVVEVKPEPQEA